MPRAWGEILSRWARIGVEGTNSTIKIFLMQQLSDSGNANQESLTRWNHTSLCWDLGRLARNEPAARRGGGLKAIHFSRFALIAGGTPTLPVDR